MKRDEYERICKEQGKRPLTDREIRQVFTIIGNPKVPGRAALHAANLCELPEDHEGSCK